MTELAQKNANKAQDRQKAVYDRTCQTREVKTGDQVLVLLPAEGNPLKLELVGPFTTTKKVTPVDYQVKIPGRRQEEKVYHINLLKT